MELNRKSQKKEKYSSGRANINHVIDRRDFIRLAGAGSLCLYAGWPLIKQGSEKNMVSEFNNPPIQTRPWCYWYWMKGNISKEGITLDLEAMAKVGIGTAFIGNIGLTKALPGSLKVLSEEWWDMMTHAIKEGGRTGVDIGVFNSPGWSQSGGPWIKPEQAMRYIIQSEIVVKGPQRLSVRLPVPKEPFMDLTVLAFPRPASEEDNSLTRKPDLICPKGDAPDRMFDGDPTSECKFQSNPDKADPVSVIMDFRSSFTARSLSVKPASSSINLKVRLEVSDDSLNWQAVRIFTVDRSNPSLNVGFMPFGPVCVVFPATTGRYWRVIFPEQTRAFGLAELNLSAAAQTEYYIEKQLGKTFQDPIPPWDYYFWPDQPALTQSLMSVNPKDVIEISSKMTADGTLMWDVPDGEWVIQRIGLTPTGTMNGPASPEATGLECDKMNKQHIAAHFDAHLGELLRRLSANERVAFKYCVADSYEMGAQNWTEGLVEVFKARFGYNPVLYLPSLSGRVVGAPEMTDRFLWDLRRLIADEVAEGYVGGLREIANKNGLKLWLENYGHWGFPSESLLYGKNSDMVGGEFWYGGGRSDSLECRLASSAVHIYGKNVCYSEAFTSNNDFDLTPAQVKMRGDQIFTEGVNHFVIHVYVHQPDSTKDIITPWFGMPMHRKNAWFFEAKSWIDYLRRCHFLLQQGRYVADIAYFTGEDAPMMNSAREPGMPDGYSYDFINADVIMNRMTMKNGRFTLPDGLSYRLIVLPPVKTMRPEILEKLKSMVENGGAIYGPKPERSPSLMNYPECDKQIRDLADLMWGQTTDITGTKATLIEKRIGKGRVFSQGSLQQVMNNLDCNPDVTGNECIIWIHRQTENGHIYFMSNPDNTNKTIEPVFRVNNKLQPSFWNPMDGSVIFCGLFSSEKKGVRVPITLASGESRFIVFSESNRPHVADIRPVNRSVSKVPIPLVISDNKKAFILAWENMPYDISGVDKKIFRINGVDLPLPQILADGWKTTFLEGIAGTAKSHITFNFRRPAMDNLKTHVMLDLGPVSNMARVVLNGISFDTIWCTPYRVDVSEAIHEGENSLDVFVTGTTAKRLGPNNTSPAGLSGPIRLLAGVEIPL